MKKLVAILFAISTVFTVQAEPEVKGTPQELKQYLKITPSEVSIKVLSKKSVKSDKSVVHFVVSSTEDTLKEAIEDNRKVLKKVSIELSENGIDRDKVSSKAFSSIPSYSFYSSKPTSFTTKKTVSVRVSSEDEFIKVLGVLDSFENQTRFLKLSYIFNDKERVENELLMENLKKAGEKKKLYEKALEVKLRVKKFEEGLTKNTFPQHVAASALTSYSIGKFSSTGSGSYKTVKNDEFQWQAADQNQKGFSEFVVERELEIIYFVED